MTKIRGLLLAAILAAAWPAACARGHVGSGDLPAPPSDPTVAPSDHSGGWGGPADEHCGACHEPLSRTACFACHKDLKGHGGKPSSHGPLWGNVPGGNEHCTYCHETLADSGCRLCHRNDDSHQSVEPESHLPGWGNPSNLHCRACHEPLSSQSCFICHKTLRNH